MRRMLPCTVTPSAITVDIIKVRSSPKNPETILVRLPSCWWWRPERLLDNDYQKEKNDAPWQFITIWLEVLQDAIEAIDIPTNTEAIVVRTNLYRLARTIKKDLYVKSKLGVRIANQIHQLLSQPPQHLRSSQGCPLELRAVLVEGGIPHLQN